jgi:hypothetical protein
MELAPLAHRLRDASATEIERTMFSSWRSIKF